MTKREATILGAVIVVALIALGAYFETAGRQPTTQFRSEGPIFRLDEKGAQGPVYVQGLRDERCQITTDVEGCSVVECVAFPSMNRTTLARTCRGAIARIR